MPAFLAGIIPFITSAAGASAIAGGVGTGVSLLEGSKAAGAAQKAQQQQVLSAEDAQKQQQQQQQLTQSQAFRSLAPDVQGQVGGSLTPDSFASLVSVLAGNPGQGKQAAEALFPNAGGGLTGNTSTSATQTSGLTDTMTHLFGGDQQSPFAQFQ